MYNSSGFKLNFAEDDGQNGQGTKLQTSRTTIDYLTNPSGIYFRLQLQYGYSQICIPKVASKLRGNRKSNFAHGSNMQFLCS
eukprot:1843582-Amphidinium_carterae.1